MIKVEVIRVSGYSIDSYFFGPIRLQKKKKGRDQNERIEVDMKK